MLFSEKLTDKFLRALLEEKRTGMSQNPYSNQVMTLHKYVYCDPEAVEIFHRKMNHKELIDSKKKAKSKIKKFDELSEADRERIDAVPDLYQRLMLQFKVDLLQ